MTEEHTDKPNQAPLPHPAGTGSVANPQDDRPGRSSGVGARLWSLRTVAAAAVTAVALGGVGGAALAKASDGGSDQGGRPGGGFGGPPGMTGQQHGQLPGQQPPTGGTQGVPSRPGAGTT